MPTQVYGYLVHHFLSTQTSPGRLYIKILLCFPNWNFMLYNKGSIDECMRCTRIKKHNCRVIGDRKHTQHHRFPFQNLPDLNIENLPRLLFIFALLSILVVVLVLSLTLLLISRSLLKIWIILLRIWTFPREMTAPSTIETWKTVTLGCWSTDTRSICLLWILVSCGRTDI